MKSLKYFLLFILCSNVIYAQDNTDVTTAKISTVLENYFDLEREAIHIHLNKTDYLTDENIWFKGYIINRKTNTLYFSTNIFVVLYDENGEKISDQLVFGYNGFFQGNISIDKNTKSGRYYIQVYTNWMNNFSEDESTLRKINIINPKEGYKNYNKVNYETLSIKINPEGGKFIKDITNTIGIEVSDCNGNSFENLEGRLVTDSGEEIMVFKLNDLGFSKISFPFTENKIKIIVVTPYGSIETPFLESETIGFGIEVNTFSVIDKTIISIETNSNTLNKYNSKKIYFVIHQDEKHLINTIDFSNKNKTTLVFDNKDLFEGINSIRIIDEELNQLSERLFYCDKRLKNELTLNSNKENGNKTLFNGNINKKLSTLSVSILPQNTISNNKNTPIIVGLRINPYLSKMLHNADYYFKDFNRTKKYELDLELLNQNLNKYNWENMKINIPNTKFAFDIGLMLKGKIDESIKNKKNHKVKILSYANLLSRTTDISEKGEYYFDLLALPDSTYVDLSLLKLPNFEKIKYNLIPNLINRNRPFYKSLNFTNKNICKIVPEIKDIDLPKINSNIINLEEIIVDIKTNKKKLTYDREFGNGNLRAYKIDEKESSINLLQFIEKNGFVVSSKDGITTVGTRFGGSTTINGGTSTPEIYIDNRMILTFNELDFIQMNEVNEVYLNPNAFIPSMRNKQGIIKIYLNKNLSQKSSLNNGFKFFVEKGFSKSKTYSNPQYTSIFDKGFENFGSIDWNPNLFINSSGEFEIEINNYYGKNATIIFEGISNDGQIIYENKSVNLN